MIKLRRRGLTWHADYMIGREHIVRGTLGTEHRDVAARWTHKLEIAMEEGPGSEVWPNLAKWLPRGTYRRFAELTGVKQAHLATWPELREAYKSDLGTRLSLGLLQENTVATYTPALGRFDTFLRQRGNPAPLLTDIDKQLATEYKYWRIAAIREGKGGEGGSGYTLDMRALRNAFQLAIGRGWVKENPFPCEANRRPEKPPEPFDPDQLVRVREQVADDADDLLIYLILRWTGMRKSDVVRMVPEEVHFNNREIRRVAKKNRTFVPIKMHPELFDALKQKFDACKPQPGQPLLRNEWGGPLSEGSLDYRLRKWGKRAGVKVNAHRFRHTFAADMVLHGIDVTLVAMMMGDTERTVRRCYLHYVNAFGQEIEERLKSGARLEDFAHTRVTSEKTAMPKGVPDAAISPSHPSWKQPLTRV